MCAQHAAPPFAHAGLTVQAVTFKATHLLDTIWHNCDAATWRRCNKATWHGPVRGWGSRPRAARCPLTLVRVPCLTASARTSLVHQPLARCPVAGAIVPLQLLACFDPLARIHEHARPCGVVQLGGAFHLQSRRWRRCKAAQAVQAVQAAQVVQAVQVGAGGASGAGWRAKRAVARRTLAWRRSWFMKRARPLLRGLAASKKRITPLGIFTPTA